MSQARQTRFSFSVRCAALLLAGLSATAGALATPHDDPQAIDPRQRLTAEARIVEDLPPHQILEIRDADDGTLGTVYFGRGEGQERLSARRGPR